MAVLCLAKIAWPVLDKTLPIFWITLSMTAYIYMFLLLTRWFIQRSQTKITDYGGQGCQYMSHHSGLLGRYWNNQTIQCIT